MSYKKIILPVFSALAVAIFVTSQLVSAASLDQALSTLPQDEEWSLMAYASLGQNVGGSFLRQPINSTTATDYEKRILAITAHRQNPANYSSENFVSKLQSMFDGNQIGSPSLLNDDIFGILALYSADINDNTVSKSRGFLLANQNSDGGWGYAPGLGSDSNTTAMAVAALAATGSVPNSATDYLYRSQASTGGFAFIPGQAADGASTAWVISGLISARKSVPAEAKSFLESLQTSNGSFKWRPTDNSGSSLVTAYAVVALSGHGLPINSISPPPPPTQLCDDPHASNYGGALPCVYPPPPPQLCQDPNASNYGGALPCIYPPPPPPTNTAPVGYLDAATCDLIGGWAKDNDTADHAVDMEIYLDGTAGIGNLIATAKASSFRSDVGNHAYNIQPVPAQLKDGRAHTVYAYALDTTTSAKILLGSKSVPNCVITPPPSSPIRVTINYPSNKIFNGTVSDTGNMTALGALISSADQINLLYQITSTSLGQFVKSVNGYGPDGAAGWQYAVNGQVPQEAAANFVLHSGDRLQWFYGNPGISPY